MRKLHWFAILVVLVFANMPTVVCRAGELLISDLATDRVLAYDAATGAFRRVVVQNDANLIVPAGMTIGFGGDLFVASQATGKVLRYNPVTGAPKGNTPGSSEFVNLGVDPSGMLYDAANDRLFVGLFGAASSNVIKIFDSSGMEQGSIQAGPLAGRTGMALDVAGNLYVNSFNEDGFGSGAAETGAVLKFSGPNFETMTVLIEGDEDYQTFPIIAGMNGLALDGSGNLYSASLFGQQVVKLTTAGVPAGIILSQMPPTAYPSGVLIDGSTLLVSTLGNNRSDDPIYGAFQFPGSVQKFDLNGNFLGVLVGVGAEEAFLPTSMALAPDPVPGDFDGDYDVDGADFVVWQDNFPMTSGASLAAGDADGDGDVDGADFVVWQTNFPTMPAPGASPVPEPAAIMLVIIGGMTSLLAHRVGRRSPINSIQTANE